MPETLHATEQNLPRGHPIQPTAQCLLGFDYGTRFVGVAIGNTLTADARPLSVIEHRSNEELFSAIARLLAEWAPDGLVVGVPRHPDGTAHEMTARAERFARQLEGRFGRPVRRVDERYSSVEADDTTRAHGTSGSAQGSARSNLAATSGRGASRNDSLAVSARATSRNDAVAASVILRQYLDAITRSSDVDRA